MHYASFLPKLEYMCMFDCSLFSKKELIHKEKRTISQFNCCTSAEHYFFNVIQLLIVRIKNNTPQSLQRAQSENEETRVSSFSPYLKKSSSTE